MSKQSKPSALSALVASCILGASTAPCSSFHLLSALFVLFQISPTTKMSMEHDNGTAGKYTLPPKSTPNHSVLTSFPIMLCASYSRLFSQLTGRVGCTCCSPRIKNCPAYRYPANSFAGTHQECLPFAEYVSSCFGSARGRHSHGGD
jgi:hypothetical protein